MLSKTPTSSGSERQGMQAATSSAVASERSSGAEAELLLDGLALIERIGSGSFGQVFRGELSHEPVAVKRCLIDRHSANREVAMLQEVTAHTHPNIITLKRVFRKTNDWGEETIYMVTDLFPMTLGVLISQWARSGRRSSSKMKLYSYQLARALAHIHGMSIVHRDIKPHNVLVNPARGVLKLADFGCSKAIRLGETNTERPTQLYLIMKALGRPSERDFSQLNSGLDPSVVQSLLQVPQPRRSCSDIIGQIYQPSVQGSLGICSAGILQSGCRPGNHLQHHTSMSFAT
jgi:serine/threonine protein kinase